MSFLSKQCEVALCPLVTFLNYFYLFLFFIFIILPLLYYFLFLKAHISTKLLVLLFIVFPRVCVPMGIRTSFILFQTIYPKTHQTTHEIMNVLNAGLLNEWWITQQMMEVILSFFKSIVTSKTSLCRTEKLTNLKYTHFITPRNIEPLLGLYISG